MEDDKENKNKIPSQIESMDNMPRLSTIEDKFIPVEEHVDTPIVVNKSPEYSIEPVKEPTTEIPPVPLVPVLGEMKDDIYSIKNNTRKKRKMKTNKKTKRRRKCKKGSRRNKQTHRCKKNKKRV